MTPTSESNADLARLAQPTPELLTCRGGHLRVQGVDVVELAAERPTPFFVFSGSQLDRNIAALREAFQPRHPTRIFFASKACSNLWILDRVRRAGIDVEVNSGGELWKALQTGFAPEQIVFNGVAKSEGEIEAALSPPIQAIVVDSIFELRRIETIAARLGVVARVAPRIDLNVASETHPGLRTSKGAKAGIDVGEALAAFRLTAELAHVVAVGMHYHIGSQITRIEPYAEALDHALKLLGSVEAIPGVALEHLNIGGGFAVRYFERAADEPDSYFEAPNTVADYASVICERLERERPGLTLFIEPGRAVVGTTAVLLSRVEAEKTKLVEGERGHLDREDWLMIDAGFNTLLEHSSYHWYFRALVASRCDEPAVRPYRLGGPLCDGGDVYAGDPGSVHRLLPAATGAGDLIAFLDVGAYSLECMSAYNGRDQAASYLVDDDGSVRLIAARRTVEDFVAGEGFHDAETSSAVDSSPVEAAGIEPAGRD